MNEQLVDVVVEKIIASNVKQDTKTKEDILENVRRRSPKAKEYVYEYVQQETLSQAWAQRKPVFLCDVSDVIEAILKKLEIRLTAAAVSLQ